MNKRKRRLLSLLLTAALVLSIFSGVPVTAEAATLDIWDGTALTEPEQKDGIYQISTGAELAWFANHVNELGDADNGLVSVDAVLTDDIYLGSKNWTPIGKTAYVTDAYAGTFDGQNHTVSGLKIDASAANYGLFSQVNTGTIKNLKVEGDVNSNNVVGGIIGKLQTGTIENCSMSGSVTSTGTSTKGYAGGIVGTVAAAGAEIKGCCNSAAVSGSYAGGILGYNKNRAVISNCYNTGDITGTTRSGGIAGQQSSGSISYCYSTGESTNGICGFSSAEITNCYYLADNTQDDTSAPGGTATGYAEITDAATLLADLNAGPEKLFDGDQNNINNGYPVLTWQLATGVISVPVTSVQILGDAITGGTLTAQALGEDEKSATNVQYQWSISDDNQTFTEIENETGMFFQIPDTADYAGKYIKVCVAGEEDSSASAVSSPISKSDALIHQENEERVQEAIKALSLDTTMIKESGTIQLPTEINGCIISWKSSHPDLISEDGSVTLPDEGIVTVTLTAAISYDTANGKKNLKVDVWAADVDADTYLKKVLESMEWDFKLLQPTFGQDTNILIKFKNLLNKRGFDGIAVTIGSTDDEDLISKNGKIHYPAIPDSGSFADGKQVKVSFDLTVDGKTVSYPTSDIYSLLIPWDTGDVRTSLEHSADAALTESALCSDGDSFSSVSSNLTLPSCLDGGKTGAAAKYSFAWITWESSDESHLAISNENRQNGADSLYNPYIGKIYQDSEEHTVTLTATVKNPSTDITVVKTFDIVITPLSEDELEQTQESMTKILDCYTSDKLQDYVTKKQLNPAAVENDIQLVIPKNVVTADELTELDYGEYWDYWNYQFTVTSSDSDLIEINSFRANVYRPLGEDSAADKHVTLTVKMAAKHNPNLFAEKDITVTVKHLSRVEINQALALMDQAKTNYARGLLGSNDDIYSIIDDLTPYKEIVWNADESDVDFVYRHSDLKRNGIMVDELPDWEEQEDWRLFHTSDKELLSNETLILNETPKEDTFVKINSVLTDEILGKYYVKFQGDENYDKEALAKFRQLYKQPVSACMMAVGAGNFTASFSCMHLAEKTLFYSAALSDYKQKLEQPIRVSFTLLGLDGKTLISMTQENSFMAGATVYDVFRKILSDHNMAYRTKGSYICSINGLDEYAYGDDSGWMYTVGDIYLNSYMNAQELSGGEDIVVKYVRDYKLANSSWKDEPTATPSGTPAASPTGTPTAAPIKTPTAAPTKTPTAAPTKTPTAAPTKTPTAAPTKIPTAVPTKIPTAAPTGTPTAIPSATPGNEMAKPIPSDPGDKPTAEPTASPSDKPTGKPSVSPTGAPIATPSAAPGTETAEPIPSDPGDKPTAEPTVAPSDKPTETPSASPTGTPIATPSAAPGNTVEKENPALDEPAKESTVPTKKVITTLKLKKYKEGTKKIIGKTIKKSRITIWIGKRKYTAKSDKNGKFTIKLKKKLHKKDRIKITVSRTGYKKRTKTFRVK